MTAVRTRALLWLPPVVIAVGLGLVISRAATRRGDREPRERAIRAHWEVPEDAPSVDADVTRYLDAYGKDPAARWFAAEAWIRIGKLGKAVDAVLPPAAGSKAPSPVEGEAASDAESARRFALLALGILGHPPGEPSVLGPLSVRTLQARIEAGDAGAAAELEAVLRGATLQQAAGFYLTYMRSPSRAVRALADALNKGGSDPEILALAATLPPSPSDGPALEILLDRLESRWRFEERGPRQHVMQALGASTSPRALAALRAARAAVPENTAVGAPAEVRRELDAGLAIAGDADAIERMESEFFAGRSAWLAEVYVGGLAARVWGGDVEAGARLVRLFDRTALASLQLQIVYAIVFAHADPPPSVPADRLADALGMSREPIQRVVAHAWALRRGRPGAREAVLQDVRSAPEGLELRGPKVDSSGLVVVPLEALRALARWAVPPAK